MIGEIFIPVLSELRSRGIQYVGFLYAGVIIDNSGVLRVLEFNCRLGDPETQVLLPRMKSDLLYVLDAAVSGKLASVELKWQGNAAACVVASSRGYPGEVDDGKELKGIFPEEDNLVVFQAGTRLGDDGSLRTKGGRVLAVSALGDSLEEALDRAYKGIARIEFEGMHYRDDIGGHLK